MSREERLKKTDSESKDFWWLSDTVANVSDSFTKEEAEPPPGSAIPKQSHHSGASQLTKANVEKYKHFQELSEKRVKILSFICAPCLLNCCARILTFLLN